VASIDAESSHPRHAIEESSLKQEHTVAQPEEGRALRIDLATSAEERQATFRLRHEIFTSLGAHVSGAGAGLDQDEFDEVCQHIAVWDGARLAATSRVLLPEAARRMGSYFSATEFDLSALVRKHDDILEIGRVCVHPDYRSSQAVTMMFRFVTWLALRSSVGYLMGCGTLFERRPERVHAITQILRKRGLVDDVGVRPIHSVPLADAADAGDVGWNDIAPLIRTYLLIGGRVLGEPCIDPIFDSAELLILMPTERLARHFGKAAMQYQARSIPC
jgi:putative hemolysin